MKKLFPLIAILSIPSCLWLIRPPLSFQKTVPPAVPNYENLKSWAAIPGKDSQAFSIPVSPYKVYKFDSYGVDIFFIHPTTYFGRTWNASMDDESVNDRTDMESIRRQATVFNEVGRIFAPRYRQATIYSFLDAADGIKALDLAYSDVLKAFDTYLRLWNQGRPIIIASHSQGTRHAVRLLRERFSHKPLSEKLIVAYLIGGAVPLSDTNGIPACEEKFQTRCFVSWRSFSKNAKVPVLPNDSSGPYICVNPLSWDLKQEFRSAKENFGGVPLSFDRVDSEICGAVCEAGVLRVTEPNHTGYRQYWSDNYHVADYALFYFNIRRNVVERTLRFGMRKNNRKRFEF
ncbi:PF11288 family protein [Leptospira broomii serovar Hurstbridge str. 5399]|uniref:PF11288 family protein n=1 Tax=Leptospira broomii serovar Hurstbridge str. 5399 TaxID=1049789 RepID=T0GDE2_9LEPT|nr:DUF3089 domain-containing protein [Leptospira broomii]EQA43433.1 PF11288 family protein [Leptospira broomii serovar Hurstbridge str. 5399]